MKRIILALICALPISIIAQSKPDDILGTWMVQKKDAKVKIYKKGDAYFGKIIWLSEPIDKNTGKAVLDFENPDSKLKSRPLIDLDIITNMKFDEDEWDDGTVYDPDNGKSYDCKLFIENGNLMVRGYLGWFYETETWTRVN